MGSLPNLHELEAAERKREKRREYEFLLEQRARANSRERERLSLFEKHHKQSSYNAYLMTGLGLSGGTLSLIAKATATVATGGNCENAASVDKVKTSSMPNPKTTSTGAAQTTGTITATLSGPFPIGGGAIIGLTSQSKKYQHHHSHPHQYQRHSLTTRHRVLRTRSSGATHNIWDEQMMEHLTAYSPVSTRSHRINPVSSYQVQAALAASRRRESLSSSIGATSIRRLITLNSRNCRHKVPLHVRQKVCRNFTCLTLAHGLMCAILLPLFALQGSNSVWHHREHWLHIGPNIGSLLLSLCFLVSAGMCLFTNRLIHRFGYSLLIAANYVTLCVFLLCHLYPSIYTLLPAYMLLGLTLSTARVCKTALIVHFGSKLSCSQQECIPSTMHAVDPLHDEHKIFCNRDQKVRRLARWFHAAQDLGIIFGALVASVVITCTSNDWNCFEVGAPLDATTAPTTTNYSTTTIVMAAPAAVLQPQALNLQHVWPYFSSYLNDFYSHNEHGERICGADMCPMWRHGLGARDLRMRSMPAATTTTVTPAVNVSANNTTATVMSRTTTLTPTASIYANFIDSKLKAGGSMLISIYVLFAIVSLAMSLLTGKIQATFYNERIKDMTDTLLLAGPMAYFIGTEQAYMLADFMRAFVSCSLGISMVAGALVGMGIMQSIVSCTLSMLLRYTKRIIVILAGFFFHSCLLLALSSWKPSNDDSALFYVIAASWGACNGMWETLLLALVTLNHTNHTPEVTAPLQALRFLGLGVTFGAHGYLCETSKIIALVIMLVVSVPPYAMLEIRLESQRKANLINL